MNSTTISSQSWFIPVDILVIICLALTMSFTIIFLLIIIVDKTCHTVRMMLVANIFFTGFICGIAHFMITVFTLYNDIKQIQYQDSFCVFRGYSSYASLASHMYSYPLLAIYQYVCIVYPTHLFWKSTQVHVSLIVLSWLVAIICPLPFTLTGQIIYNIDNQICQVPFRFSWSTVYIPQFVFIIPINSIMFIYTILVRYVKRMNNRVASANRINRAQKDLNMVRRIVALVHTLLIAGFPMTLFIFLSFANLAPKYHFRIGFTFSHVSSPIIMIALFQFTNSLKVALRKIICHRSQTVISSMAIEPAGLLENRITNNVQYKSIEIPDHRIVKINE